MPNNLVSETSPYLLQHKNNPVNWFPWNDDAFEKAKAENKPIFLSIGYSTCHWCHVMAHESFEDEEVAELLNKDFISIKVDREERPDIDHIYMNVTQMLTGMGGWPMTVILTPDKKPFFAGTYFPKKSRFGRIGMMELLPKITDAWKDEKDDILETAQNIVSKFKDNNDGTAEINLDQNILDKAFLNLQNSFDSEFGGFGSKPKFPTPHNLIFLLRYWKLSGNNTAKLMVEKTLDKMHSGGIYDHIGGGFHRYSTDEKWILPHFEKMLYDNALMLMLYSEAYLAFKNDRYRLVANEIISYLENIMKSNEGGFYSAEDADSEGEEGKFYVWEKAEIKEVLKEDAEKFCDIFNITEEGNFIEETSTTHNGKNIIYTSNHEKLSEFEFILNCKEKLYKRRIERVRPFLDDKILHDWNGLMVGALAFSARKLKSERAASMARKADAFLEKEMTEGTDLFHSKREDKILKKSFLDDYAYRVFSLLELFKMSGESKYLNRAKKLQKVQDDKFKENGNYFFINNKDNELFSNPKEIYDGAMPSGNSVSFYNLMNLYYLTGESDYQKDAEKFVSEISGKVALHPEIYSMFLIGFISVLRPTGQLIISDVDHSKELKLSEVYNPFIDIIATNNQLKKDFDLYSNKDSKNEKITFYLCRNFSCENPDTDIEAVMKKIKLD